MDSTFEERKRKHVLCPSSTSDTSFPGIVAKEGGVKYELVREFGIDKQTAIMLSTYRDSQAASAFSFHEKNFNSFARRLVNTKASYDEWKTSALER